jgi:uncharacterized protein DUF5990
MSDMSHITMRIRGPTLPGIRCGCGGNDHPEPYDPIHLGIQRGREVVDIIRGDAAEAVFEIPIEIRDLNGVVQFHGPHVQRRLPQQFIYLNWGEVKDAGQFRMFRQAKLHLTAIDPALVQRVVDENVVLEGALGLTDGKGNPLSASVRPPVITWSAVPS